MYNLLIINPGSTSTKIACYRGQEELLSHTIEHSQELLASFKKIVDQKDFRTRDILDFLKGQSISLESFNAIVGRGGMLPPVKSGAYEVNDQMILRLSERPLMEHASNLGALIAFSLAKEIGVKAYIYDSTKVDELTDIARISGMEKLPRISTLHTLNSRAVAMKVAQDMGEDYQDIRAIVAHLGGGISLSIHDRGRIIDIVSDDEGPFSPTRGGRLHIREVIHYAYSGISEEEFTRKFSSQSGLLGYLNTADAREVEKRIAQNDSKARLIYEAMAYQVAKSIGELSTTVFGQVDVIILTGGIAYSKIFTQWIVDRTSFIAPVKIYPGEHEMKALAKGILRVLEGKEPAHIYTEE